MERLRRVGLQHQVTQEIYRLGSWKSINFQGMFPLGKGGLKSG